MGRWSVGLGLVLVSVCFMGVVDMAFASTTDLLEVDQVAEGIEGSIRTWAFRAFIVVAIAGAFLAIRYEHTGLAMFAMVIVFLAVFIAKGPDKIADLTGLASAATVETDTRLPLWPELD